MASQKSILLQLLHHWAHQRHSRNALHLVLFTRHPHPFLHFCSRVKFKISTSHHSHLLHLSGRHVLLPLPHSLHRPGHHSQKALPRKIAIVKPTLSDPSRRVAGSGLLDLPHNPTLENQSLFSLPKLRLNIRPSLWLYWHLHRKTELQVLHHVPWLSGDINVLVPHQYGRLHHFQIIEQHQSDGHHRDRLHCQRPAGHPSDRLLHFPSLSGLHEEHHPVSPQKHREQT